MGLLSRIFGQKQPTVTVREAAAAEVRIDAEADGDELVEVEIVGEGHRQDVIERIAGPKEAEGKQMPVGLTLRCEPMNEYDANAIRVEVYGQQVGFVAADVAARMSPAMCERTGQVLEGRGLVVGGWRDSAGEGSYGVRGWITATQAERLGLAGELLHHARAHEERERMPYPAVPAASRDEERITPEGNGSLDAIPSEVTVTGEEHYQDAILASRPDGWRANNWPVLVDFAFAPNPHVKSDAVVVEVRADGAVVGYFTAKMSERHRPTIEAAIARGRRPTAVASVNRSRKAGSIFELRVGMKLPEGTPVEFEPAWVVNTRTGTRHTMGTELPNGWRTQCGEVITTAEIRVLGKTRPGGLIIDVATRRVATSHYVACGRCP